MVALQGVIITPSLRVYGRHPDLKVLAYIFSSWFTTRAKDPQMNQEILAKKKTAPRPPNVFSGWVMDLPELARLISQLQFRLPANLSDPFRWPEAKCFLLFIQGELYRHIGHNIPCIVYTLWYICIYNISGPLAFGWFSFIQTTLSMNCVFYPKCLTFESSLRHCTAA